MDKFLSKGIRSNWIDIDWGIWHSCAVTKRFLLVRREKAQLHAQQLCAEVILPICFSFIKNPLPKYTNSVRRGAPSCSVSCDQQRWPIPHVERSNFPQSCFYSTLFSVNNNTVAENFPPSTVVAVTMGEKAAAVNIIWCVATHTPMTHRWHGRSRVSFKRPQRHYWLISHKMTISNTLRGLFVVILNFWND